MYKSCTINRDSDCLNPIVITGKLRCKADHNFPMVAYLPCLSFLPGQLDQRHLGAGMFLSVCTI